MGSRFALALAGLALAGCSAQAAVHSTLPPAPPTAQGASDVPEGWTTVGTPDSQALAFRCALAGTTMRVTVWNISAVQEQAWHLTVVPYLRGGQQAGTMSFDIGDNWVQPRQRLTFSEQVSGPAVTCRVTGLG